MPQQKQFEHPVIGNFTVTKRANAKKVTLRIAKTGIPNVTVPKFMPYQAGVAFIKSNVDWVEKHAKPIFSVRLGDEYELYDGSRISIHETTGRRSTRNSPGHIAVFLNSTDQSGQNYFHKLVNKHLAADSENVITNRLSHFQAEMGTAPTHVRYRATTSRWGSCSQKGILTFSVYIAQLPNELINYIVVHELSHLEHMNHSTQFWQLVGQHSPNFKQYRKDLKSHNLEPLLKKVV